MRTHRLGGVAVTLAAALAIAACGSSNSSSSSSGGRSVTTSAAAGSSTGASSGGGEPGDAQRRRLDPGRCRSTSSGAPTLKTKGLTVNYNAVGSGTGVADLQTATVDFAGSDPALKAD